MSRSEAIRRDILMEIIRKEYRAGMLLPSERGLMRRYGVSRTTVREALERLESEGVLQAHARVGYAICPPQLQVRLRPDMLPVRDFLRTEVDWIQTDFARRVLTDAEADVTGYDRECDALFLMRDALLNGELIAKDVRILPWLARCEADFELQEIVRYNNFEGNYAETREELAAYRAMWDICNSTYIHTSFTILLDCAGAACEGKRDFSPGEPLYRLRFNSWDADGKMACFREVLLRADRVKIDMLRSRR